MSATFDELPDRQKYGANRRESLLNHYFSQGDIKSYFQMVSMETDLEEYLKRKLGFSEWNKNWDLGLYRENDKEYLLLSKKNDLDSYEVLERVEYTEELKPVEWINICLKKYTFN